jgi:cysteine synthase B
MPDPSAPNLLDLVGGTPLVELKRLSPRPGVRILAKLEGQNPSGSIKDRIARGLVEAAERRGDLKPGARLIEASTGNTAIGLAMVARQKGYELAVAMPRGVVPSIEDILQLYGVHLEWVDPFVGMKGAIDAARRLADRCGGYLVNQFGDPENVATHYRTTGAEIAAAVDRVDVLVAGIGTGGTIMGVGRRLREQNPDIRVIGVEPRTGEHLQGLRSMDDQMRAPLLDLDALDGRFLVGAADALAAAHQVVRVEGIMAGVSSGATLHAALRQAERMDSGTIVCMFSDGGWKYLPARPWDAALKGDRALDDTHWW